MSVIKLADRRVENKKEKSKLSAEQLIEEAILRNKNKDAWSQMCYIPVDIAIAELQNILANEEFLIEDKNDYSTNLYRYASMMAVFAGWDKNDNKVKEAMLQEDLSDVSYILNTQSVFERTGLGIYIKCNFNYKEYLGCDFEGVFVHINHTFLPDPHELELRAYFVAENKKDIFPCNLTLINGKTLSACLCETLLVEEKEVPNDRNIPTLEEIEACEDSYQRDILYYKLKYKIFNDLFSVLL